VGLFRRRAAKALTEAQIEALRVPAIEALRSDLQDGEQLDDDGIVVYLQAADPSTGTWYEGSVHLLVVTSQQLCFVDLTSMRRALDFELLRLDGFQFQPHSDAMLIRFSGPDDTVQQFAVRLAGPKDWPPLLRTSLIRGWTMGLTEIWERQTGRQWDWAGTAPEST
jgi:hypothetical protein